MKKIVHILLSFVFMLSIVTVCLAAEYPANQRYAKDRPDSLQKKLVDVQEIKVDLEGNILSDNVRSVKWVDVKFYFYDMGFNGEKKAYEVQMTAESSDPEILISYTTFYAKPTNNTKWFKSAIARPNVMSCGDAIYYDYPDSGPKTPKCRVKATISTNYGTTDIPETTLSKPVV